MEGEGVLQKWEGSEPIEVNNTEVVSHQQQAFFHFSSSNNGIQGAAAFSTNEVSIGVNAGIHFQDVDVGKNENSLPAPERSSILDSSTGFVTMEGTPVGIVIQDNKGEEQEIHLTKIFVVPKSHGFYCPHCRTNIEKVLFYKRPAEQPELPLQPQVVPPQPQVVPPPDVITPPVNGERIRCSACFQFLIRIGSELFSGLVSHGTGPPAPEDQGPESRKRLEVLKSIVYGGLNEILASLSVVTSAASADATTLSIVALAFANLIGGLFVLVHNLRDLKAEQPRARGSEDIESREATTTVVDKYSELLGHKDNFILHAFVAFLSFLVFGLVPPIVYGFSFPESNDKDLKLAAVAGASLICITLLAIAKAYVQRSNGLATYLKTVLYYVATGALASVLTYVAGALMERLVEKLGWFEPTRPNFALSIPDQSVEKPGWGSY